MLTEIVVHPNDANQPILEPNLRNPKKAESEPEPEEEMEQMEEMEKVEQTEKVEETEKVDVFHQNGLSME